MIGVCPLQIWYSSVAQLWDLIRITNVRSADAYSAYNIIMFKFFHIELPSVQLQRRFEKFLVNAADDDKVY